MNDSTDPYKIFRYRHTEEMTKGAQYIKFSSDEKHYIFSEIKRFCFIDCGSIKGQRRMIFYFPFGKSLVISKKIFQ